MKIDAEIRALDDRDADGVVALYERAARADPRLGPITLESWRAFTTLPQNSDGRDFRIAEYQGSILGLAESSLKDQGIGKVRFFKIVVDPASRRRGIGSALLRELLAIDAEEDLPLQTLVSQDWSAGLAFVSAFGFRHVESEIHMRCGQLLAPAGPPLPSDVAVARAADAGRHASGIARIHNAAYAADVAFNRMAAEDVEQLFDGYQLWTASAAGSLLGYCQLECQDDYIWLESLAIAPDAQARGIGAALAYQALAASGVSALCPANLNVASVNTAAMRLYQKLGFVARSEIRRYAASRHPLIAAGKGSLPGGTAL